MDAGVGPVDQPGSRVAGRYRVQAELARGGMSVLHEVEDESTGTLFVLRRPRGDAVAFPELANAFLRSANAACRLGDRYTSFPTVRVVGEDALGPYMVVERVNHRNLADHLRSWRGDGAPAINERIELLQQVAAGLAEAHREGLLHLDLKPSNILAVRTDGHWETKLIDLDGASPEGLDSSIFSTFTLPYAAPEQAAGLPVATSMDVHAFGVVAYEVLTLQLPTEADESLAPLVPELPGNVARCLDKCRSLIPMDRPRIKRVRNLLRRMIPVSHLDNTLAGPDTQPAATGQTNDRKSAVGEALLRAESGGMHRLARLIATHGATD